MMPVTYIDLLQGFDPNSAFFTKVVNKKKKVPIVTDTQSVKPKKEKKAAADKSDDDEELDQKTLRSRQLASMLYKHMLS